MKIILYFAALLFCISAATSCRNDDKACDTAKETELTAKEALLNQREKDLSAREAVLSGGSAGNPVVSNSPAATSAPNQGTAGNQAGNGSRTGFNTNDPKVAYKKPVLSFPGQYPESSERLLTERDMEHQSAWGKKVMLNEIYARHGMLFSDADLKKHFNGESWYKGVKKNIAKGLTKTERANIAFIKAHT